jgi:hypothetical protein
MAQAFSGRAEVACGSALAGERFAKLRKIVHRHQRQDR